MCFGLSVILIRLNYKYLLRLYLQFINNARCVYIRTCICAAKETDVRRIALEWRRATNSSSHYDSCSGDLANSFQSPAVRHEAILLQSDVINMLHCTFNTSKDS